MPNRFLIDDTISPIHSTFGGFDCMTPFVTLKIGYFIHFLRYFFLVFHDDFSAFKCIDINRFRHLFPLQNNNLKQLYYKYYDTKIVLNNINNFSNSNINIIKSNNNLLLYICLLLFLYFHYIYIYHIIIILFFLSL